jgi:hypothetical protein
MNIHIKIPHFIHQSENLVIASKLILFQVSMLQHLQHCTGTESEP